MFGARTLRIRSSLLASAAAVVTVAAALAAGNGTQPQMAIKGDRLPMPVQKVSCEGGGCPALVARSFTTDVEHDRNAGLTTLTRIPVND